MSMCGEYNQPLTRLNGKITMILHTCRLRWIHLDLVQISPVVVGLQHLQGAVFWPMVPPMGPLVKSMAWCTTALSALQTHLRYCGLALSHWNDLRWCCTSADQDSRNALDFEWISQIVTDSAVKLPWIFPGAHWFSMGLSEISRVA